MSNNHHRQPARLAVPGNPSSNEQVEFLNVFFRALDEDTVRDKIFSLLTFEDMKALSVVSKSCCSAVRNYDNFKKRARLIICKDSVAIIQILQEKSHKWTNITLDLRTVPELKSELITPFLESTESIRLWASEITAASNTIPLKDHLTKILTKTPNLQDLEMDSSIFINDLSPLLSNTTVQTMLANLKVFIIQSKILDEVCFLEVRLGEVLPFQKNFRLLAKVPFKLRKFVFGKVIMTGTDECYDCLYVKYIPTIVQSSKDTLETLELHLNVWKLAEMKEIICPKLKNLLISACEYDDDDNDLEKSSRRDTKIVEAFLRNQPPLEELVIKINDQFPLSIVQTLKERVRKMKKLHIKAKYIPKLELEDWNFLKSMDKLTDFQIRKPQTGRKTLPDNPIEILTKLPATIEKISVQGFCPFWAEIRWFMHTPKSDIGEFLCRFRNLKEISLKRSSGAVSSKGMQSIISFCKKLTSLEISHCRLLSNFGISGVIIKGKDGTSEEKIGVSLKELKDLTRLKLRCCPHISPERLLQVVEFDSLRYFDYDRNVPDPRAFLTQLVRQNPCLEEVALRITNNGENRGEDYLQEMKDEMKQTNPRVRITNIPSSSIWEQYDTDSDASVISDEDDDKFVGSDSESSISTRTSS